MARTKTALLVATATLGLTLLTAPVGTASATNEPTPALSPTAAPDAEQAPVVISAAAGEPATMTFTRVPTEESNGEAEKGTDAEQSAESAAAAADIITCSGTYDSLHPASYSDETTINAHLTVSCNRPVPLSPANMDYISLSSRMYTGTGTAGALNSNTVFQRYSVRIGGDLQCFASPLNFYATGSWTAKAPAGYVPNVQTADVSSLRKKFVRQADGTCKAV